MSSPNTIDKLLGHFVQYDLEVGGYLTRAESSLGGQNFKNVRKFCNCVYSWYKFDKSDKLKRA